MTKVAEKAALMLKESYGLDAEIIDPRTIVPLDEKLILKSIQKTSKIIIIEESPLRGGVGSEIAAIISEKYMDWLDYPVKRIASKNTPLPVAPLLEKSIIPNEEIILKETIELLGLEM